MTMIPRKCGAKVHTKESIIKESKSSHLSAQTEHPDEEKYAFLTGFSSKDAKAKYITSQIACPKTPNNSQS